MKPIHLLILFSLLNVPLFAQLDTSVVLSGNVFDEKGLPLVNVLVKDVNSNNSTQTDSAGIFILRLAKTPTSIQLSYDGYLIEERKIIDPLTHLSHNDTLLMIIQLKIKTQEIDPIEIFGSKSLRAYDKPEVTILDFDLHSEGLLLLVRQKRNYFLRLVDGSSNTLFETTVPKFPEALLKDCLGNWQIVYKDSVYQVVEEHQAIGLLKAVPRELFNTYLEPCVAATNAHLFLKKYGLHNQSIFYSSVDRATNKSRGIHSAEDRIKAIAAGDLKSEIRERLSISPNHMAELNVKTLHFVRVTNQKIWFYESIMSLPLYIPLFQTDDSLFIFDHTVDSLLVFDQRGTFSRSIPLFYPTQQGWENEIVMDQNTSQFYAKFLFKGVVELHPIDLATGHTSGGYRIEKHAFPEKIKVRNGSVYYVHKELDEFSFPNVYVQTLD